MVGVVPGDFSPPTLITSMFLHGSWSHVIGIIAGLGIPTAIGALFAAIIVPDKAIPHAGALAWFTAERAGLLDVPLLTFLKTISSWGLGLREMIEMIRDPLTHIIRNAVDHGIETPAERLKAGKREIGILCVSARQSGNQILIDIQDDGRGIDGRNLVDKAGGGNYQTLINLVPSAVSELLRSGGLPSSAWCTCSGAMKRVRATTSSTSRRTSRWATGRSAFGRPWTKPFPRPVTNDAGSTRP